MSADPRMYREWTGSLALLANMFGADLGGGEEREKRGISGGCLHCGAAVGFFPLHNANHRSDFHAGFAGGFNGVDGGCAGGADIVDDYDAGTFATEAFNAAACAVSLFGFADQESMKQGRSWMIKRAPGAGSGDIAHDGVGAHGKSAYGIRCYAMLLKKFQHGVAGETPAFGMQRGGAAGDVVVACAAGGKLELAEAEAGAGKKREQLLGVCWLGHH